MGSRGKRRRRANGELAVSRRGGFSQPAPLVLSFSDEPLDPVPADLLAQALRISNKHLPIGSERVGQTDEGDDPFENAFEEMKSAFGDEALARKVDGRLYLLREFLQEKGSNYYTVKDDGDVAVRSDLLEFAATGPLSGHPDERLSWCPNKEDRVAG